MYRRPRAGTPPRHSAFAVRALAATPSSHSAVVGDLLYHFELRSVLDCHAVYRAALSATRDLTDARAVLIQFDQMPSGAAAAGWDALEIQLHHTINAQGGNSVLASLSNRTQREVHELCAAYPRGQLDLAKVQSQHRAIINCIEAGQADSAVQHTRAHIRYLRDQALAGVMSTMADLFAVRP